MTKTNEGVVGENKLRPYKDVIFDTMRVKPGVEESVRLFQDNRKFPDGTPKRAGIDTNMALSGQLGYPRFFDLVHWMIVVEEFASPKDVRTLLANLKLELHFGECHWRGAADPCVPIYKTVGSAFQPIVMITDGLAYDWLSPGRPLRTLVTDYDKLMEYFEGLLKIMAERGEWTHFYCPIVSKTAIRIESVTAFCVHADVYTSELSGPVTFKVMLRGLDYRTDPNIKTMGEPA